MWWSRRTRKGAFIWTRMALRGLVTGGRGLRNGIWLKWAPISTLLHPQHTPAKLTATGCPRPADVRVNCRPVPCVRAPNDESGRRQGAFWAHDWRPLFPKCCRRRMGCACQHGHDEREPAAPAFVFTDRPLLPFPEYVSAQGRDALLREPATATPERRASHGW